MSEKYDMSSYSEPEKQEIIGAFNSMETLSYYMPSDLVKMFILTK